MLIYTLSGHLKSWYGSCEETLRISALQNKKSAVSSRHEPRKCHQQTAIDPLREPPTDELANRGCGAPHRRGPLGESHLDSGRPPGSECVLWSHREQRGTGRATSVRSATADQFVGVRL